VLGWKLGFLILGCIIGVVIWLLATGCKAPATTVEYKTLAATDTTVVTAWGLWTNYVALSNPPSNTVAQVSAAFAKVKGCELLAVNAAQIVQDAGSGTNAAQVIQLSTTSQASAQALSDLISLLSQFGIKL